MCTVTFIPAGPLFFFTSSRDEQANRPEAEIPAVQELAGHRIMYPKDPLGGGSWIAVHDSGNVAILLNGAVKAHQPEPPYRKSRGIVLLDLISATSPADNFEQSDFREIEPFTVILFDHGNLYSGKWDGKMRWLENLNVHKPYIWSSVTLYDPPAVKKREAWFMEWLIQHPYPGTLDIIHFHQKGGDGDPFNDILMKRNASLSTRSISSVRLSAEYADFRYLDLHNGQVSENILPLAKQRTLQA